MTEIRTFREYSYTCNLCGEKWKTPRTETTYIINRLAKAYQVSDLRDIAVKHMLEKHNVKAPYGYHLKVLLKLWKFILFRN